MMRINSVKICCVLFLFSCTGKKQNYASEDTSRIKEDLIGMNKEILKRESDKMDEYAKSHNLQMTESGTGLRYSINHRKDVLPNHRPHDKVTVSYFLFTFDGKEVKSFPESNPFEFLLAQAEIIKGIEEAVMMMNEGDDAMLLIPSHLAFGKLTDEKNPLSGVPLFCTLKLLTNKSK